MALPRFVLAATWLLLILPSWLAGVLELYSYATFYFIVARIGFTALRVGRREWTIFALSYFTCYVVGSLLVVHHLHYYGVPFDIYGDDERFFLWGTEIGGNILARSYSFYEKLIGIIVTAWSPIGGATPYQVLPVNWIAASVVVIYAGALAEQVSRHRIPVLVLMALTLGNYTFLQNSVHLYRDVYVALGSVGVLYHCLRREWFAGFLGAAVAGAFRLPSGIIGLFVWVYCAISRKTYGAWLRASLGGLASMVALALGIGLGAQVGKYDLSNPFGIVESRVDKFQSEIEAVGGAQEYLQNLPVVVRVPLNIPYQTLRPFKVNGLYKPVRASMEGQRIFNHRSVGWAVTTALLVFFVGPLLRGILVALARIREHHQFLLTFVLYATVIGFLSFLDRHRVILIPLFPTLWALSRHATVRFGRGRVVNRTFDVISSVLFALLVGVVSVRGWFE